MADPHAVALKLARVGDGEAALVLDALRDVPCPFVWTVSFSVWQASPTLAVDAGCEDGGRAPARAGWSDRAAPAVAVEPPHLAASPPPTLVAGLRAILDAVGTDTGQGVFLDAEGWWVELAGSAWFATVHADAYPSEHSRHWPRPGALVVLVPKCTFDTTFPHGIPESTRRAIRTAFGRHGRRYPGGGGAVATT